MDREMLKGMPTGKIIKRGIVTLNKIKFQEYQMTNKIEPSIFVYSLSTYQDQTLINISVTSPLNLVEQNRKRIADIVGSISTKK
jgi:hypothetical protein